MFRLIKADLASAGKLHLRDGTPSWFLNFRALNALLFEGSHFGFQIVAHEIEFVMPDAHPHRFRDTLAVDMLMRGASPYDVAKVLGDTIETVEKHYTPFVKELRERVRSILENGAGLESSVTLVSQTPGQIN
jgi:hypothetical protein